MVSVLPFIYMLTTSLKTYGSVITGNLWPWPPLGTEPLQWAELLRGDRDHRLGQARGTWPCSSAIRSTASSLRSITVAGVLLTSTLAAYALAQMNVPGKNVLFMLLLATIMIPADLTLVPKVVMMYQLPNPFGEGSWYNTYLALIVPFLASVFGIFLLRQFFMQMPKDLFDAAADRRAGPSALSVRRSSCRSRSRRSSRWRCCSSSGPGTASSGRCWSPATANMRVLAVGLQQFMVGEGGTKIHLMMAFATMVVVPVIVVYFFTQKYFTQGFTTTDQGLEARQRVPQTDQQRREILVRRKVRAASESDRSVHDRTRRQNEVSQVVRRNQCIRGTGNAAQCLRRLAAAAQRHARSKAAATTAPAAGSAPTARLLSHKARATPAVSNPPKIGRQKSTRST